MILTGNDDGISFSGEGIMTRKLRKENNKKKKY